MRVVWSGVDEVGERGAGGEDARAGEAKSGEREEEEGERRENKASVSLKQWGWGSG